MQKKVLLSSILVIALCMSVIAGSTYALFTDEAKTNIAITSGDVEVKATLAITGVWSAAASDTFEDSYLVDEHGTVYNHVDPAKGQWIFTNGGEAILADDANIAIYRITPGDKVDAKIIVENTGDVDMIYRYKVVANNGKLADGMVVTVDGKDYEGAEIYVSAWSAVIPVGNATYEHEISLELPVYAGNEYQTEWASQDVKDVSYTITVEAVQGNAKMPEYNAPSTASAADSIEELQDAIDAYAASSSPISALINLGSNIAGDIVIPQSANVDLTIDGNGNSFDGSITIGTVSGSPVTSALTIKNVDFIADSITYDAFIRLGNGTNNARYIKNVTIDGCTFTDTDSTKDIVAIKSYTGGDKNITISNCVVEAGMHSLLQVKNVEEGLVINNCKVYSKNGVNVVSTPEMLMSKCVFDVEGYAFRTDVDGAYEFDNCSLKSACAEADDAVIVLRVTATENAITLNNTTLTGEREISVQ